MIELDFLVPAIPVFATSTMMVMRGDILPSSSGMQVSYVSRDCCSIASSNGLTMLVPIAASSALLTLLLLLGREGEGRRDGRRKGGIDDGAGVLGREARFQTAMGQGADGAFGIDGRGGVGAAGAGSGEGVGVVV